MAIIERTTAPLELAPATGVAPGQTLGVFKRPMETTGLKGWLFTIDHKKLGIMSVSYTHLTLPTKRIV